MTPHWSIARPRVTRLGVRMAAFTGRSPVELSIVPFPSVSLFLDLGDAAVLNERDAGCIRGTVAVGIDAGPLQVRTRNLECLQVRISPAVAYAIFGGAVRDLATEAVGLDAFWGVEAERLRNRLRDHHDWDSRFAIVESALARRCRSQPRVDAQVAWALRCLEATHGRVRVDQLASELGWSRKHLWSRFRSQVGITAKRAARLVRFDRAAHLLASGRSAAAVAADCGYADQSHLNRDTTALAGLTPSGVAVAPWLRVDPVAWPDRHAQAGPIAPTRVSESRRR